MCVCVCVWYKLVWKVITKLLWCKNDPRQHRFIICVNSGDLECTQGKSHTAYIGASFTTSTYIYIYIYVCVYVCVCVLIISATKSSVMNETTLCAIYKLVISTISGVLLVIILIYKLIHIYFIRKPIRKFSSLSLTGIKNSWFILNIHYVS